MSYYKQKLARLRRHPNSRFWDEATNYRAPHKPLLLLAVMDLVEQGSITQPFVEPSFELAERFIRYWQLLMPAGSKCNMAYPFYRMQSEGFWYLAPQPGQQAELTDRIEHSLTALNKVVWGAQIDAELFRLFCEDQSREELRNVILDTYFSQDIREVLRQEALDNQAAAQYSQILLQAAEQAATYEVPEKTQHVRDQGFRKAIMNLYKYRCSICGIRMLTPEGNTVVEAAHIHPWSESRDDRPANGLALCKLCHWSFDYGFVSVSKEYRVLVSCLARSEQNNPGHIMTLEDRPIIRPAEEEHLPDHNCLKWHRRNRFREQ